MEARKGGFTLLEIIVVMVIVGILVAIALPNYFSSVEQMKAQTAQNNLMAIAAAQSKYYEDNSNYYFGTGLAVINAALHLSMSTNDTFKYSCFAASPYNCTATDGTDSLALTYTTAAGAVITCGGSPNSCPTTPNPGAL